MSYYFIEIKFGVILSFDSNIKTTINTIRFHKIHNSIQNFIGSTDNCL